MTLKRPIKTINITFGEDGVIRTVFGSSDSTNPVNYSDANRAVQSLRSEHSKFLRMFRLNQRLETNQVQKVG